MPRLLVCIVAILTLCSPLRAWSTKEHLQLTRIAISRLIEHESTPPAMKQWLRDASPGLMDLEGERRWFMDRRIGIVPRGADGIPYWSVMPDTVALMDGRPGTKVEPFGVAERLLHYVDLEIFLTGDQKRAYRHDLSGKPRLQDVPRDLRDPRFVQAGMLPFRVEDSYRRLVEHLRAGRLDDRAGQHPRDEHAAKWAGYLAHYLLDNTQPHHATVDFRSAAYFANQRRAPNVHAQLEYGMADDEHEDYLDLRQAYWPLLMTALEMVKDPIETDDPWQATLEVALISYDALPLIGVAAMKAAGQDGTPDAPTGPAKEEFDTRAFYHASGTYLGREMSVMEMKAHQQAWAVKRVQRLFRQAWDEANPADATPSLRQR